ncbi:hypothetical protein WN944_022493 [Citrus x changshan-huyou]|uniref:Uncharacterized protein n=1 Tax=Citrus x changshan-huyou TaxID=2935761 RepID=A0AAP0R0H4_9ROSI
MVPFWDSSFARLQFGYVHDRQYFANTSTSSVHPSAGEARGKESSKSSNSNISENLFMQMENLDLLRQNSVGYLERDMKDFPFKLLGEGFQLNRDVIKEVLDSCGYDMQNVRTISS